MRKFLVVSIGIFISAALTGQSHFEPNYALKSPQTLEVINIEFLPDQTILMLSIENLIEGGYFCIDKETYITTDSNKRYKLTKLSGLPNCPNQYKFKREGEIKYITMYFPAIPESSLWIDLIEECGEGCLTVIGLSLEPRINSEINICFRDMEKGRINDAIQRFEVLRKELKDSNNPILGSIYLNLITLYKKKGDSIKAEELSLSLKDIIIPHKELFLSGLDIQNQVENNH